MKYETYPEYKYGEEYPLYIIEFTDWENGKPLRWKLCKRSFVCSKGVWDMETSNCNPDMLKIMSREGHPLSLLEDEVLPDHCIPNRKWLEWMVDALNEKVLKAA
jgi:hypothetical protein